MIVKKKMISGKVLLKWMAIVFGILICQTVLAQGFAPNVLVNQDTTGEQSTDGTQKIAVLEDSVYVVWAHTPTSDTTTIYFAKSTDKGETFGSGIRVSSIPDSVLQLWPSLAVNNSGEIYVAWTVLSLDWNTCYGVWFAKSINGGRSFEPAVQVSSFGIFPSLSVFGSNVYVLFVDPSSYPMADYYFARSTNCGESFEPPYQINDAPCQEPIEYFESLISLCVDAVGNIYAVWNDGRRLGGNGDIYFAKSVDAGASFGTNIPVNDITIPAGDSIQWSPSVAVEGTDTVYVAWTDMRFGSSIGNERVYCSRSTDGGANFGADNLVGEQVLSRCPSIAASESGLVYIAYEYQSLNGRGIFCNVSMDGGLSFLDTPIAVTDVLDKDAKYPFIAIGPDEKAYVVWQDSRLGNSDIYFSKGEIVMGIEENNSYTSPITFELIGNYPNPFNASTSIKYTLPTRAHIELTIYNIQGQLVRTLLSGEKLPGTYIVNWDGRNAIGRNVSSGIYFYQLEIPGGIQKTRKMLLLK